MSRNCTGCKYAPANWREFSQLPTCTHPRVINGNTLVDPNKGVWQLYGVETNKAPCGTKRKLKVSLALSLD